MLSAMKRVSDHRLLHGVIGAVSLTFAAALIVAVVVGRFFVPGLLGEWLQLVTGLVTTPIILEISAVIVGFMIVTSANAWRRHRDGDEFVYLEEVSGPEARSLPQASRSVVYRDMPLDGECPQTLDLIEGALSANDFETAGELLASLSPSELGNPKVLALRLEIANRTGKLELAARIAAQLAQFKDPH